jgi:hypothetical protein
MPESVTKLFEGRTRTEFRTLNGQQLDVVDAPVLSLDLDVMQSRTPPDSIRHLCERETLRGENRFFDRFQYLLRIFCHSQQLDLAGSFACEVFEMPTQHEVHFRDIVSLIDEKDELARDSFESCFRVSPTYSCTPLQPSL